LLTSSTYCGRHHFNRTDSRPLEKRPLSQLVELDVPPMVAKRSTIEPSLCFTCERPSSSLAQRQRTDDAGIGRPLWRLRLCNDPQHWQGWHLSVLQLLPSNEAGQTACPGRRIRMDRLDDMVLGDLSEQLFATDRLAELLQGYMVHAKEGRAGQREKLRPDITPLVADEKAGDGGAGAAPALWAHRP
jgi:site-specific DNA recombinase